MEGQKEENTNEQDHESIDVPFHIGGFRSAGGMVGIELERSIG